MATLKKPIFKKTTVKAKPAHKKSTVKSSHSKTAPMQSFKVFRNDKPFISARITRQTVYWSILLVYIMIMQVWILNIQLDIIQVTDSITTQIQRG